MQSHFAQFRNMPAIPIGSITFNSYSIRHESGRRSPLVTVPNWTDTRPEYCHYRAGFDGTHGGHVPWGVTAHGSPGGPLQFDCLEATLAARFR